MSQCLAGLASRYVFAQKFKDSAEGSSHHQIVTPAVFDAMVRQNAFLQWHMRYGRRYGLARDTLDSILQSGKWPLVHVGRLANLLVLRAQVERPISILLRCREDILRSRLIMRHPDNVDEQARRIEAMHEEIDETRHRTDLFDIIFDNNFADPEEAAMALHERIEAIGR